MTWLAARLSRQEASRFSHPCRKAVPRSACGARACGLFEGRLSLGRTSAVSANEFRRAAADEQQRSRLRHRCGILRTAGRMVGRRRHRVVRSSRWWILRRKRIVRIRWERIERRERCVESRRRRQIVRRIVVARLSGRPGSDDSGVEPVPWLPAFVAATSGSGATAPIPCEPAPSGAPPAKVEEPGPEPDVELAIGADDDGPPAANP